MFANSKDSTIMSWKPHVGSRMHALASKKRKIDIEPMESNNQEHTRV